MFAPNTDGVLRCETGDDDSSRRITQISWFKSNLKLSNDDKYELNERGDELKIRNVNKEDSGKYICRAYIGQTQTGKAVYVKVEDGKLYRIYILLLQN